MLRFFRRSPSTGGEGLRRPRIHKWAPSSLVGTLCLSEWARRMRESSGGDSRRALVQFREKRAQTKPARQSRAHETKTSLLMYINRVAQRLKGGYRTTLRSFFSRTSVLWSSSHTFVPDDTTGERIPSHENTRESYDELPPQAAHVTSPGAPVRRLYTAVVSLVTYDITPPLD